MNSLERFSGVAAPLLRDNIDTDAIIPSREMTSVSKTGLADGLFAGLRYLDAAARTPNPTFVLNDSRYRGASILLAGANFGCGSSREHAAWALREYGFRAILAPSFNPIFRNNCISNAMGPVEVEMATINSIAHFVDESPFDRLVEIDVKGLRLRWGQASVSFPLDSEAQQMLISGLDPIERTLREGASISAFLRADAAARPWCYAPEISPTPVR